jgi:dihydrofolate reductase
MSRPEIVLIAARSQNGVIGRNGGLPWHIPADLKRFKRLTVGKPIIMGRKTFDSIGRPLPGRHNIVITRSTEWGHAGVTVAPNLAEAIAAAGLNPQARADEIMIIGGGEIYAQSLAIATRLELTQVDETITGDTYFPEILLAEWQETFREDTPSEGVLPAYSFVTLVRRTAQTL